MIPLTTITRGQYESLLEDGRMTLGEISERYGAGWIFRLHGVLCAMAVRQCASDAESEGEHYHAAHGLYDLVVRFRYDTIFEDNGLDWYKPSKPLLDAMMFSMCQAETGDYSQDGD